MILPIQTITSESILPLSRSIRATPSIDTKKRVSPSLAGLFEEQVTFTRRAVEELNFDRNRDVGKFLNYLVKTYIHAHTEVAGDIVNRHRLEAILSSINAKLHLMKPFKDFAVNASLEDNPTSIPGYLCWQTRNSAV